MDEPEQVPPYQRLQQLLAIPERQRTEAQWDEINELEIALTGPARWIGMSAVKVLYKVSHLQNKVGRGRVRQGEGP